MIEEIKNWLDEALAQPIPEDVAAFCFNLYENGAYSDVLKSGSGVGVGFVDGDIEIIYKRGD